MYHGMAHLDSCRKSVEDKAADLALKNRDEIGKVTQISLGSVNCCGEVAFESAGNLQNLIATRVTDKKRGGAKYLRIQVRSQERSSICFKKCGGYGKPCMQHLLSGLRRRALQQDLSFAPQAPNRTKNESSW